MLTVNHHPATPAPREWQPGDPTWTEAYADWLWPVIRVGLALLKAQPALQVTARCVMTRRASDLPAHTCADIRQVMTQAHEVIEEDMVNLLQLRGLSSPLGNHPGSVAEHYVRRCLDESLSGWGLSASQEACPVPLPLADLPWTWHHDLPDIALNFALTPTMVDTERVIDRLVPLAWLTAHYPPYAASGREFAGAHHLAAIQWLPAGTRASDALTDQIQRPAFSALLTDGEERTIGALHGRTCIVLSGI